MRPRHCSAALFALAFLAGTASLAAPTPSRNMSTYVLLGLDTLNMKEFAFLNVGNVGVNNPGGTESWGRASFFKDGTEVVTDVLKRAGKNSSLYDLYANTVVSPLAQAGATIRHDGPMVWTPTPLITPLPPVPSCSPGAAPVVAPKGGTLVLGPGSYGKVQVPNGATLELTGGTYCLADVKVGRKSTIVVDAAVNVTVMGKYRSNPGSRLVAAAGSGIGATDIVLDVAGTQVKFGHKSKVFAVVYAPNAVLRFGRGGFYTGQFVARDLRSDFADTFTLEVCGNGVIDPGEHCDDGAGKGQPGHCCNEECGCVGAGTG